MATFDLPIIFPLEGFASNRKVSLFLSELYKQLNTTVDGKANTALSNLSSVAINASLVFDTNNTYDLASSSARIRTGYFATSINLSASSSGNTLSIRIENTSNTASSQALLEIGVAGSSAGDAWIKFSLDGFSSDFWALGSDQSAGKAFKLSHAATLGTTDVFSMSTAGEFNLPLQPAFLVTDGTGASNVTGDGTIYTELWPTEIYDQGGDFASNTFTAPVTGRYILTATVRLAQIDAAHTDKNLTIHTSNRDYLFFYDQSLAQNSQSFHASVVADMDSGDTATVTVKVSGSTKTVDVSGDATLNYFSGHLAA